MPDEHIENPESSSDFSLESYVYSEEESLAYLNI